MEKASLTSMLRRCSLGCQTDVPWLAEGMHFRSLPDSLHSPPLPSPHHHAVPGLGVSLHTFEPHCRDGETEARRGSNFPGCFCFPWAKHPAWKVLWVKNRHPLHLPAWERSLPLLALAQCSAPGKHPLNICFINEKMHGVS